MLRFIIFTVISTICFSVYGQNWQDEQHVWDEEKQEWVVKNEAHGRVVDNGPPQKEVDEGARFAPPAEEWSRFLPLNVRNGKRQATNWEISEAQRKLWAKQVMRQRAVAKAEQRRQLIAYRRATGWYAARRNAGLQYGASAYNYHMSVFNNSYYGGGGYAY